MASAGARIAAAPLDLLIALAFALILFIVGAGGTVFTIGSTVVSMRSVTNPLVALYLLLGLRCVLAPAVPFPFSNTAPRDLGALALRGCTAARAALERVSPAVAARWVLAILLASAAIKIAIAVVYFGFYSGDDVEVQEMSFAALFGWQWEAWNLRNAFYPLAFLYPPQRLLVACGIPDPAVLITAGRLVVTAASLVTLWMVYRIGTALSGHPGVGLLACGVLALSRTHTTFAASELPRTVAAMFLTLAFCAGLRDGQRLLSACASGALIGLAAVLRFSEAVFVVSEGLALLLRRRPAALAVMGLTAAAVAAGLWAVTDALYWGSPFYSVRNIVRYTLVDRLSSRGVEPWHYYASHLGEWSNPLVVAASIWCARLGVTRAVLWTWLPVIALSLLPHKEPRYLIPIMPFLAVTAAIGLHDWLRAIADATGAARRRRTCALVLVLAVIGAALFELGGFHFRRSESAVRLARENRQPRRAGRGDARRRAGLAVGWPSLFSSRDAGGGPSAGACRHARARRDGLSAGGGAGGSPLGGPGGCGGCNRIVRLHATRRRDGQRLHRLRTRDRPVNTPAFRRDCAGAGRLLGCSAAPGRPSSARFNPSASTGRSRSTCTSSTPTMTPSRCGWRASVPSRWPTGSRVAIACASTSCSAP